MKRHSGINIRKSNPINKKIRGTKEISKTMNGDKHIKIKRKYRN